jgi:hypothetical protein
MLGVHFGGDFLMITKQQQEQLGAVFGRKFDMRTDGFEGGTLKAVRGYNAGFVATYNALRFAKTLADFGWDFVGDEAYVIFQKDENGGTWQISIETDNRNLSVAVRRGVMIYSYSSGKERFEVKAVHCIVLNHDVLWYANVAMEDMIEMVIYNDILLE